MIKTHQLKEKAVLALLLSAVLVMSSVIFARGPEPSQTLDKVRGILKRNCTSAGCHSGKYPPAGLNLEPDRFPASVVGIASQEKPGSLIVDPAAPEKSYLLAKIKGEPGIVGVRMPAKHDPLSAADIQQVEEWLKSLAAGPSGTGLETASGGAARGPAFSPAADLRNDSGQAAKPKAPSAPAFWGTRLVNLPTTTTLSRGELLFRVSHRFQPPASSGWDSLYGFDGPAFILLSLGYGITDNLMVTVGRSKLYQEWDFGVGWAFLEPGEKSSLPISATLHAGGSLVTLDKPQGTDWSGRFRFNALVSLSYQLDDRLSVLLVPAFSSNTNFWEPDSEGTFALGIGGRFRVFDDVSLFGEWMPALAGYKDEFSSWGLGVEKKIGGHVFQFFVTDSIGLLASQYLTGGDLRLGDGDFRFGFNIFRSF